MQSDPRVTNTWELSSEKVSKCYDKTGAAGRLIIDTPDRYYVLGITPHIQHVLLVVQICNIANRSERFCLNK